MASVIVWDHKHDPPGAIGKVLHWQSYAHRSSGASVPRYLEDHAERLRAKYLAFIHDLGESQIDGKRIVEHLDLGDGFSFWWMTQLSEKSPFKSARIYGCLRLMALEEILLEEKPSELTLDSSDRNLAQAIRRLCQNLRINFIWRPVKKSRQEWSLRSFYRALPYSMQGLISLRHLVTRWPLRKLQKPQWFSGNNTIFLCSYFFNLDPASGAKGRFSPRQWEGLPKLLQDSGKRANWIHHFLLSPGTPDVKTGLNWLRLFNHDAYKQGYHTFLETYLSWSVVLRALKNWIRLNAVSWRLREISRAFNPKGSAVWLWPLLRSDWLASLNGSTAISNCLWVELFDVALKNMPNQKIGLYIWENQGWECALLRAWRRHGHGEIIGVPHATVVYWHLNNFDDPRSLISKRNWAKPLPNHLAVNGPMAWKAFVEAGYPPERLLEVEALRFQYLTALGSGKLKKPVDAPASAGLQAQSLQKKVLILGDFTFKQTLKMLRCIEAASHLIDTEISLTLKPHPVCPIEREDCPTLSFELTDAPLAEIMPNFDLAFSSNSSSAGLDALLAGLSVVIFLDDEDFNHSPLRGVGGIRFASTAEELAHALQAGRRNEFPPAAGDFFWVDNQLPRWRKLVSEVGING
jgi:surface carbohydrate biosynthesis protein (TIGR04326 family)